MNKRQRKKTFDYKRYINDLHCQIEDHMFIESLLRSLLSEEGVRDTFLTYAVGVEIINRLEGG